MGQWRGGGYDRRRIFFPAPLVQCAALFSQTGGKPPRGFERKAPGSELARWVMVAMLRYVKNDLIEVAIRSLPFYMLV